MQPSARLLSPLQRSTEPAVARRPRAGDPRRPCFRSANVRALAALPPGLVAGDIDLGPYIVALSPHRVVAAPYHRLEQGILANHAITHGTPEQALRLLEALGVDYLALCADRPDDKSPTREDAAPSLGARLLDGDRFAFLRELDLAGRWRHQGLEGRADALSRRSSISCAASRSSAGRGRRLAGAAGGSGAISGSALGQEKSSARPGLVARRSPLISTW